VRVPCANGKHRTLDSAVDFGPGEEGPHLSSGTGRLRATCHRRLSRIAPRHWTPGGSRGSVEWRVPASRAQKEKKRFPESGSRGVSPKRSVSY